MKTERIALEVGANCASCDCGRRDGVYRGRAKEGQVFCTRYDKAVSYNGVCANYSKTGTPLVVLHRRRVGELRRVQQTDMFNETA